jgi:serine/threonine protein kinase
MQSAEIVIPRTDHIDNPLKSTEGNIIAYKPLLPANEAEAQPTRAESGLESGALINNKWLLLHRVGRGAFGDIFIAEGILPQSHHYQQKVALKIEKLQSTSETDGKARAVLKLEAVILSMLQPLSSAAVARFIEYGRDPAHSCAYLSMSLLGENLLKLRKKQANHKFSLPTVLRFGQQALRSLEALHSAGFINRDVKPSNFCVGAGADCRKIYMIDFGLARCYIDRESKQVLPARPDITGFRGTPRYASIYVHRCQDLGRRDDLWSLLYILVEFITGDLPWNHERDKVAIHQVKEQYLNSKLLQGCPKVLWKFMKHIYNLKFDSKPDYEYLYGLLESKYRALAVEDNYPYDWEDLNTQSTIDNSIQSNEQLVSEPLTQEIGHNPAGAQEQQRGKDSSSNNTISSPNNIVTDPSRIFLQNTAQRANFPPEINAISSLSPNSAPSRSSLASNLTSLHCRAHSRRPDSFSRLSSLDFNEQERANLASAALAAQITSPTANNLALSYSLLGGAAIRENENESEESENEAEGLENAQISNNLAISGPIEPQMSPQAAQAIISTRSLPPANSAQNRLELCVSAPAAMFLPSIGSALSSDAALRLDSIPEISSRMISHGAFGPDLAQNDGDFAENQTLLSPEAALQRLNELRQQLNRNFDSESRDLTPIKSLNNNASEENYNSHNHEPNNINTSNHHEGDSELKRSQQRLYEMMNEMNRMDQEFSDKRDSNHEKSAEMAEAATAEEMEASRPCNTRETPSNTAYGINSNANTSLNHSLSVTADVGSAFSTREAELELNLANFSSTEPILNSTFSDSDTAESAAAAAAAAAIRPIPPPSLPPSYSHLARSFGRFQRRAVKQGSTHIEEQQ